MVQKPLFTGLPPPVPFRVIAYHDESGHVGKKQRFLLHGILFVPNSDAPNILLALERARDGYRGSIHYADLRDNNTEKGKAARTWMEIYESHLGTMCYYKCLIVDMESPSFDRASYTENHHIYNRFAAMAIWAGIQWSFPRIEHLELRIVSEEMSRKPDDRFHTYVPAQLAQKASGKRGLSFGSPALITVPGDLGAVPMENRHHCELLQLTDLLTSSIAEAVQAKASRAVKQELAMKISNAVLDTRALPWLQKRQLHRRFSVSCFPSEDGDFYDVDLAIRRRLQDALL